MKLRENDPWMPADEYGRSLRGLTVNLLVRDMETSLAFQTEVLGAEIVYSDPDFAVCKGYGSEWMLHADHTYRDHPLRGTLEDTQVRGGTVELRLHGCDPDRSQAAAERLGHAVLEPATNKPHGLREAYLLDPDGYIWVPDVPSNEAAT